MSLPVRGAWIEISSTSASASSVSPSLPVRGAWIEILQSRRRPEAHPRRSPCGERGLKYKKQDIDRDFTRRSPCGERGLKSSSEALTR